MHFLPFAHFFFIISLLLLLLLMVVLVIVVVQIEMHVHTQTFNIQFGRAANEGTKLHKRTLRQTTIYRSIALIFDKNRQSD